MRNGYRERRLDTRVGSLALPIPKLREGSYFPSFLEPRRRSEEALLAVIAEAYVKGVSTRKVEDLVAALGLEGISKSEVSRICARLDEQVEAFRGRPLLGRYPYLFLDATYEKVRDESGRVVSMALVVAYGVAETGEREVLGLEVCRSEDYAFWRGFLAGLVARGLSGVSLVVSDAHQGAPPGHRGGLPGSELAALPGALPAQPALARAQRRPGHGAGRRAARLPAAGQGPGQRGTAGSCRSPARTAAPGLALCFLRPKRRSLPTWTSPPSTGSRSPPPIPWSA